jgi:hypothetical protein
MQEAHKKWQDSPDNCLRSFSVLTAATDEKFCSVAKNSVCQVTAEYNDPTREADIQAKNGSPFAGKQHGENERTHEQYSCDPTTDSTGQNN